MSLKKILLRTLTQRNRFTKYISSVTSNEQGYRENNNNNGDWKHKYSTVGIGTALLSATLIGSNITDEIDENKSSIWEKYQKFFKVESIDKIIEAGEKRTDLPTYRAEEVGKHDTKSSFWVIYKHGVYDMTEFLSSHPGGEQILNAGGLSIEPFWNVYGMHKTPQVFALLESFRIGNLHEDDFVEYTDDELWAREPFRDKRLIVKTARPFNAEIPPEYQIAHFDTPNELFYVRQHMAVPELSPESHSLRVTVVGGSACSREFSLEQLARFERSTVRAALMCAGNRRTEMDKVADKSVKGLDWGGGAVSCAVWGGVRLRDVLLHCGVDPDDTHGKHVIFRGADVDATGTQFSTSIPLSQALEGDVLLATHMNGAPLPPDHGRPLRAVVPGAPAFRSVKWLESITVSEEESPSHWHQRDYRSFNASVTWETADFPNAPPLYSLPVTSAICSPAAGARVRPDGGHVLVQGYAYSGGGARVVRVDVSADGGASWRAAEEVCADPAPAPRHYAWLLWAARVPVPPGQTQVELWAKATDSNFNTQPENFHHIWNIRGVLANAYHRVTVHIDHCDGDGTE